MNYPGWIASLIVSALLILSVILPLIMGISFLTGGGTADTEEENRSTGMTCMMCSGVFVVLAIICGIYGILGFVTYRRRKDLASMLKISRRIKLTDLAKKVKKPYTVVQRDLLYCVEKGYVKGYLDRETEEFFLEESLAHSSLPVKCNNCGSMSTKVIMHGEVRKCEFCGSTLGAGAVYPGTQPAQQPMQPMPQYQQAAPMQPMYQQPPQQPYPQQAYYGPPQPQHPAYQQSPQQPYPPQAYYGPRPPGY